MASFPIPKVPIITSHQIIIIAPITGIIMAIKKRVGSRVKAGDTLLILEAMKMENEIVTPEPGVVKVIKIKEGQKVKTGAPLVVITPLKSRKEKE
jgi:biotin carboxyl carrier protein